MKDPLHYTSDVRSDSQADDLPAMAVFDIDEHTAKEILKLAGLAAEHELFSVLKFDYRVTYLKDKIEEGEDFENAEWVRTDDDCLHVTACDFWFSAYIKHSGIDVRTNRRPITELAAHFGLPFEITGL